MTQPISGGLIEPYLGEPIEHNLSAPSKEFDFYIEERSDSVVIYREDVNTKEQTFLTSIFSDRGLPIPEYSYSCEVEKCPEGTCSVECGDIICCYNSDGIAVKNFQK